MLCRPFLAFLVTLFVVVLGGAPAGFAAEEATASSRKFEVFARLPEPETRLLCYKILLKIPYEPFKENKKI
jgi:hypothetical protein